MGSWFATEQALPDEDEAIRFIVGQREVPLHGWFREGTFTSRWWRYRPSLVRDWSAIDDDRSGEQVKRPRAPLPGASA
jgi:hypothetical protein